MSADTSLEKRVFTQLALWQSLTLFVALFLLGLSVRSAVRSTYLTSLGSHLAGVAEIVSRQLPASVDAGWCAKTVAESPFRLSVISPQPGAMVCDTIYRPGNYPELSQRPEVTSALESSTHRGRSLRVSRGLSNIESVFATRYMPERNLVIRTGLNLDSLQQNLAAFDRMFLVAMLALAAALTVILQWTSRKIAFARAAQAVRDLEVKMRADFVANVSHEFRTPLTSIRGFAEAAMMDLKAGKAVDPEFVDIIKRDSDRLLTMVNDVLDLSALDAGSLALEKHEIPTQQVTEDALKRLHMVYAAKRPAVEIQYGAETVFGDYDRLLQILINLVGNSMKYGASGVRIQIQWSKSSHGTRLVVFDNGPGIPVESRAAIFNRFVRVREGQAKTQGAGLGLAIVKGLVEIHDGTIALAQSSAPGSRFEIWFPAS